MSKNIGKLLIQFTVAAVVAVTFGVWIYVNMCGRMGNLFVNAPAAGQMILYGRGVGLLMALCFLFELLTMGKGRSADKFFPKQKLFKRHKFIGFFVILLLVIHVGLILQGRSLLHNSSWFLVWWEFVADKAWGSVTAIGVGLLIAIWIFTFLSLRKKISMEFWRKTHYLTYPAVLLVFFHQVAYGLDFVLVFWFKIFWIVLFVLVSYNLLSWMYRFWRHGQKI